MNSTDRLGIKLFARQTGAWDCRPLIGVFQCWIQQQSVPGHTLIDVHDYSHIHQGPGVLLVGHEGNFSFDNAESRPGLQYWRKRPLDGSLSDRLRRLHETLEATCGLLESQQPFSTPLRFDRCEVRVTFNDRLVNDSDSSLVEMTSQFQKFAEYLPGTDLTSLSRVRDGSGRFMVELHLSDPSSTQQTRGKR